MNSKIERPEPLEMLTGDSLGLGKHPISLHLYSNENDLRELFRLRYRAYHHSGLIEADEIGEFSDYYDGLPSSKTIGAFYEGRCVGSLRLAFGKSDITPATMPSQTIFPEIADLKIPGAGTLVEFTRMVVDPELANNSFRSTLYGALVRGGMIVCNAGQADYAFIAVLPKMMRFYQTMCGFDFIAGPRLYPGVTEATNLMGRNFHKLEARRTLRNPFFKIAADEIVQARKAFAMPLAA